MYRRPAVHHGLPRSVARAPGRGAVRDEPEGSATVSEGGPLGGGGFVLVASVRLLFGERGRRYRVVRSVWDACVCRLVGRRIA
jgi:hypothetical protein